MTRRWGTTTNMAFSHAPRSNSLEIWGDVPERTSGIGRPPGAGLRIRTKSGQVQITSYGIERQYHNLARDGWITPAVLSGQKVWLRRTVVTHLLGRGNDWVKMLERLGMLLGRKDEDNTSWIHFDPAWRVSDLKRRWLEALTPPTSYAEWENYEHARRAFGYRPEDAHPPLILDAATDFLEAIGPFIQAELQGILEEPQRDKGALMRLLNSRRKARNIGRRLRHTDYLELEYFRETLPEPIAHASGTCFDDVDDDDYPPPTGEMLARLDRLGPLRCAATLLLLRVTGRGVTPGLPVLMMHAFERIDQILVDAGVAADDVDAVGRLIHEYAVRGTLLPTDSPRTRDIVARQWLSLATRVQAIADASPHSPDRDLRPFVPACPMRPAELRRLLRKRYGNLRKEGTEERKRQSDLISNRFDFLIAASRRRCDQLADFADDGRAEAALLLAGDDEFRDFETPGPVLKVDGTYGEGMQTINGRVWRADALWRHLHATGILSHRPVAAGVYRRSLAKERALGSGQVIFEYRGTTSETGDETAEPWFATLFKAGASMAPKSLRTAHKERRADLIRRWRLPGCTLMRNGFLSFDRNGSMAYRYAEAGGIDLIPLEQFDYAMRVAHLAFRASAMTGCRAHEAMQMVNRKAAWPILDLKPHNRTGWMAIPKQDAIERDRAPGHSPERFFMVDDDTFVYFRELCALLIKRCHADMAKIPDITPVAGLRHKCGPAPYVFSFAGLPLTNREINAALRFLLAGIEGCSLHLVRHASANRGYVEGDDLEAVMERLNQRGINQAAYYARLTPDQRAAGMERFLRRREVYHGFRAWEEE